MPISNRLRLAALGVLIPCAVFAQSAPVGAPTGAPTGAPVGAPVGTPTVDVMNKLWGKHAGVRANHAKGLVTEGTFTPSKDAPGLSKAAIFAGPPVPVTVRFSNSTGLPDLPDGNPNANPHGMAIQFRPPGAPEVHVVVNSLKFFPVANGQEFLELLTAVADSPPDAPKPTKIEQFMAAHPAAPKAFGSTQTPSSFARETYNGIDAFIFVNNEGVRQPFRFRFDPVAGPEHLTTDEAAKMPPGFLAAELNTRLAREPAKFRVMAQLGAPGDSTRDPTQPWPDDRRLVDLGELVIAKPADDQVKAASNLRLLPSQLEPGIEVSDDPLISARVQAYVISFGRRAQ